MVLLVILLGVTGVALLVVGKHRLSLLLTIAVTWTGCALIMFWLTPSEIAGLLVLLYIVMPLAAGLFAGATTAMVTGRRWARPIAAGVIGAIVGSIVNVAVWALGDATFQESILAASAPAVLAACFAGVVAALDDRDKH